MKEMVCMGNLDPQMAGEVIDHVKRQILTALPTRIEQLSGENVEALRNKLHVLHFYCLQRGVDPDITRRLEAILKTCQGFWELLEDNASMLVGLQESVRMRWFSLSSSVLTTLEEIISGEESFRDIIVNSISIILAWKADTIWVDMAEGDLRGVPQTYVLRLRDELWQFIGESSQNGGEMTLEKASEIGEKMNLLLNFIASDDMPVVACIMLLSQVYLMLIRLNLGKIIMILEESSKEA